MLSLPSTFAIFFLGQNNSAKHACQYFSDVICRDLDSANVLKVTDILFALQIGKNNIQQTMGFHKGIFDGT